MHLVTDNALEGLLRFLRTAKQTYRMSRERNTKIQRKTRVESLAYAYCVILTETSMRPPIDKIIIERNQGGCKKTG